jgi:LCP family protein required for cell wall assembly
MNKAKGCFITILVVFVLIIFGFLCVFVTDLNPTGKNVLILGVDKREENMGLNNTDTIIIYHISSLGEKDCLISIPRDTRREGLAEYGIPKINAAYEYGGEDLIKNEIHQLTGIEIDRILIMDFNGFKEIIDVLEGVRITVEEPLDDELSGAHFEPGTYDMDGEQALSFARCRATSGGDIDRMARQQYLINEIIKQKLNISIISKTTRLIEILNRRTQTDFTIWDFCSIGFMLLFSSKDINRVTIPTVSANIDNISFQIADEEEVKEFLSDYLK